MSDNMFMVLRIVFFMLFMAGNLLLFFILRYIIHVMMFAKLFKQLILFIVGVLIEAALFVISYFFLTLTFLPKSHILFIFSKLPSLVNYL